MPKRHERPTRRVHLHLPVDDIDWLQSRYGHTIGVAAAVRSIVATARRRIEERIADKLDTTTVEVDLPQELTNG